MLSTGIRTPVGVKVIGTDLVEIDKLAKQIEQVLKAVPGTSSAYAERGIGGYYLDIDAGPRCAGALRHHGPGRAGRRSRPRSAARPSPPPWRAASASPSTCAIRAICAPIRRPSPTTCWCRCRPAARCRSARSPTSQLDARADARSAPRTASSRPTSTSTSATATSAATSPTRSSAVQASIQFPPGTYVVWSGQFEYLERADGAAEDRGAGDAADHLPAALPQLPLASPKR